MEDLSLAELDKVFLAIESAVTVQEIKDSLNIARAAEVYAKQAKVGKSIELKASEYIVRAERKLGKILSAAKLSGQIKVGGKGSNQHKGAIIPNGNNSSFTLEEAGIHPKLSSLAQKVAALTKEEFEERVSKLKEAGKLTSKMVIRSPKTDGSKPVKPKKPHQVKDKSDRDFYDAVNARVKEFLENTIGPQLAAREKEARRIINSRKGIMDRKSYRKILACLHPDWVTDPKQKLRYEEAFHLFTGLEKLLLDEKNSPTPGVDIPTTAAEWDELRRKAKEQRKAKRSSKASSGITRQI